MRYFITALVFQFFCFGLKAQDWQLFPYGQESIYAQELEGGSVYLLSIDSVNGNVQYFNRKAPEGISQAMYDEVIYREYQEGRFDSLAVYEDSVLWYTGLGAIKLLPNMQTGETLPLSNGYYADCITGTEEVFGITDSIKSFFVWHSDMTVFTFFKLSKNFGLIEFIHPMLMQVTFPAYTDFPFRLLGMKKDGIDYGVQLADWENYMPMNLGDRLYYSYTAFQYPSSNNTTKREVYILSAEKNDNEINIYATNKYVNSNGSITYSDIFNIIYEKNYILPLLKSRVYAPVIGNTVTENGESVLFTGERYYEGIIDNKLFSSLNFIDYGISFNTDGDLVETTDILIEKSISIYPGITSVYNSGLSGYTHDELIGFHIGDSIWGITDIMTNMPEVVQNQLHISPNPVSSILTIQGLDNRMFQWQIVDMMGKVVLNGEQYSAEINVATLPAGTYLLLVENVGKALIQKE